MSRERAAVTAVFFLNGMVFVSWYSRMPSIQDRLDLGTGALGLALLGAPLGLLLAQPLTGRAGGDRRLPPPGGGGASAARGGHRARARGRRAHAGARRARSRRRQRRTGRLDERGGPGGGARRGQAHLQLASCRLLVWGAGRRGDRWPGRLRRPGAVAAPGDRGRGLRRGRGGLLRSGCRRPKPSRRRAARTSRGRRGGSSPSARSPSARCWPRAPCSTGAASSCGARPAPPSGWPQPGWLPSTWRWASAAVGPRSGRAGRPGQAWASGALIAAAGLGRGAAALHARRLDRRVRRDGGRPGGAVPAGPAGGRLRPRHLRPGGCGGVERRLRGSADRAAGHRRARRGSRPDRRARLRLRSAGGGRRAGAPTLDVSRGADILS